MQRGVGAEHIDRFYSPLSLPSKLEDLSPVVLEDGTLADGVISPILAIRLGTYELKATVGLHQEPSPWRFASEDIYLGN